MVSTGSVESIAQAESKRADVISPAEAETLLLDLAAVFLGNSTLESTSDGLLSGDEEGERPHVNAIYRALVEQIPAVVFISDSATLNLQPR
jgi:hypothetical protein